MDSSALKMLEALVALLVARQPPVEMFLAPVSDPLMVQVRALALFFFYSPVFFSSVSILRMQFGCWFCFAGTRYTPCLSVQCIAVVWVLGFSCLPPPPVFVKTAAASLCSEQPALFVVLQCGNTGLKYEMYSHASLVEACAIIIHCTRSSLWACVLRACAPCYMTVLGCSYY